MLKIKKFIWKVRYAIHFGDKVKMKFSDAWGYAEASLENINYEVWECPLDIADEDIEVMRQDV